MTFKEGNPDNDVGESDMQIQITSVQGNVGKLYQDRKILPLPEDESIKINPIEIEGVEKAILQIKQQKTIKEINHAIFRSTRYTDEQIFNIIDEYTEDLTQICALAKKYSVAVQTIRNWAQVAGKNLQLKNPLKRKRAASENKDQTLEHGDSESTISATELDIEDFESTIIKQEPEDPFSNDFISCDQITEEITDQITEEITDQISDPFAVNDSDHDLEPVRKSPTGNCKRIFDGLFPAAVSNSPGPSTKGQLMLE